MRQKKMLRGDGLNAVRDIECFMNAVRDIGRNNLYEEFVNSNKFGGEDDKQVGNKEVHVKFNTLVLVQFSKVMANNPHILPKLKDYFHGVLPEIELKKAKSRDLMKLLKKEKIISWDNLNPLTEKLESIVGKDRYHELFGDLFTEYFIENGLIPIPAVEIVNENGDPFINGTADLSQVDGMIMDDNASENLPVPTAEFIHDTVYLSQVDGREVIEIDDGNEMDDNSSENSPVPMDESIHDTLDLGLRLPALT